MPRIVGIDIPENKKVAFALRSIYGVGPALSTKLCSSTGVDPDKRAKDLTADEINKIQKMLERHMVEGDLRRQINDNIDRLRRIRSYRGMRHAVHLPARGQRTRTNSRTVRGGGKRRTVGSMSKEMATKLEAKK